MLAVLVTWIAPRWRGSTKVTVTSVSAVDLVARPLDPGASITVIRAALPPEQRRIQELFELWLDRWCRYGGPSLGKSIRIDVATRGVTALDALAEIVEPMTGRLAV